MCHTRTLTRHCVTVSVTVSHRVTDRVASVIIINITLYTYSYSHCECTIVVLHLLIMNMCNKPGPVSWVSLPENLAAGEHTQSV